VGSVHAHSNGVVVAGGKSLQGVSFDRNFKRACACLFCPAYDVKGTPYESRSTRF